MQLVELRKDGVSAYVKPKAVLAMLKDGWDLPTISVRVRHDNAKSKR